MRLMYLNTLLVLFFFFFNDTATTEIYTLSLHDALPISSAPPAHSRRRRRRPSCRSWRSEEHTSELQSHSFISYAVFCLKKKDRRRSPLQRDDNWRWMKRSACDLMRVRIRSDANCRTSGRVLH